MLPISSATIMILRPAMYKVKFLEIADKNRIQTNLLFVVPEHRSIRTDMLFIRGIQNDSDSNTLTHVFYFDRRLDRYKVVDVICLPSDIWANIGSLCFTTGAVDSGSQANDIRLVLQDQVTKPKKKNASDGTDGTLCTTTSIKSSIFSFHERIFCN